MTKIRLQIFSLNIVFHFSNILAYIEAKGESLPGFGFRYSQKKLCVKENYLEKLTNALLKVLNIFKK